VARSELINGAQNSKTYITVCTFYEVCTRKSVDMRIYLMAAIYFVARQCAPASVVSTYISCGVGMAVESTHQDMLYQVGVT
jgi:hypothetical protein